MPRIMVRKCPKTGKLFETDAAYRKHIRRLRKVRNDTRAALRVRKAAIKNVRDKTDQIKDIPALEEYVKNSFHEIMIAYNGGRDAAIHRMLCQAKMTKFELRVSYSDKCSNTHAAPRDGETNWGGRKEDVPRGYPGFHGHVNYTVENNPEKNRNRGNLCLEPKRGLDWAGIHAGGGGGRGKNSYEFGVTIFLSDFAGLEKQHFLDKLAGTVSHIPRRNT